MFDIETPLREITDVLPKGSRLVAVSKYHPSSYIAEAYRCGQRVFGESIVKELQQKKEELPSNIEWHFIGHLQTNKVKYIAPYVSMIHAVDTFKLLEEIDKQAAKCGRIIPCLLQLHVAQEETKFGFTPQECLQLLADGEWRKLTHVRISGIMCMASNTDNEEQIRNEFHTAFQVFQEAKQKYFADSPYFTERSWGMSDDYPIALQEGSTLIRVGSKIFGPRIY